jgi:hypothetical protein
MQAYWRQPATYDSIEFDTRFRPEVLDFWLPHFVRHAEFAASQRVLDIGCETGGFAMAIAQRTQGEHGEAGNEPLTPVEYPTSPTHHPHRRSSPCTAKSSSSCTPMYTDDGREETVTDVLTLNKDSQRIEHLGLTLAEAKQLLTMIQQRLLAQQVVAFLASHAHCTSCGSAL